MDESSVELPLDRVIEACEVLFDFYIEEAREQWNTSPKVREENPDSASAIAYSAGEVLKRGPHKLHRLCVAAKASGETKVRVSAADFWPLIGVYKSS